MKNELLQSLDFDLRPSLEVVCVALADYGCGIYAKTTLGKSYHNTRV